MRTVHETDSLRAAELALKRTENDSPAPMLPPAKPQKLKLVFGSSKSSNPILPLEKSGSDITSAIAAVKYPIDCRFTDAEASLTSAQLFELLRRQIFWAQKEGRDLEQEVEQMEEKRKREWLGKELVLENLMEAEFEGGQKRKVFVSKRSRRSARSKENDRVRMDKTLEAMRKDAALAGKLPMKGLTDEPPWYRGEAWQLAKAAAKEAKPKKDREDRAKDEEDQRRAEEEEEDEEEEDAEDAEDVEGEGEQENDEEEDDEEDDKDGDSQDDDGGEEMETEA